MTIQAFPSSAEHCLLFVGDGRKGWDGFHFKMLTDFLEVPLGGREDAHVM